MRALVGIVLTVLAVHFALTTLALAASGRLRRPLRVGVALVPLLVVGLALLGD